MYLLAPLMDLQKLFLANNRLEHFCEDGLLISDSLRIIDLSNNKLKSLGSLYANRSKYHPTTTDVSDNQLVSLEEVDLSHNQLTRLNDDTVSVLRTLKQIDIHHNPWSCDCESLNLLHMIKETKVKIRGEVICADKRLMKELGDSDMCPNIELSIFQKYFRWIVVGVISLLMSVASILTMIYYKNKTKILIYCYSSRILRWFVSHPDALDVDKVYDAFISFANEDIQFVADILVPHLEENGLRKYKLCLHYRDWVVGGYILNQIHTSIKRSRRTIIVLSPAFLQSVWGEAEFRTAYTEEMREGRLRLIVIMYQDIGSTDGLAEELKDYIQTTTYLKWEDTPTFWKRLYYVLPHPLDDSERVNVNCFRIRENSRHSSSEDNCMDLQTVHEPSEQCCSTHHQSNC